MPSVRLQKRDHELMSTLLEVVRVASFWQIVSAFFPSAEAARTRLGRLVRAGFLSQLPASIVSLELRRPLYEWPSMESFNSAAISWQLEKRWAVCPSPVTLFIAGPRAEALFDCPRPKIIPAQLEHDVAVAQVYFSISRAEPSLSWMSETEFHRKFDGVVPDLAVINSAREPTQLIEIGGRYSVSRLDALHEAFSGYLPWQLY